MNIAFFEDLMRFCCIMTASSISGNSYFSPAFQMFNTTYYSKVADVIDHSISQATR
jgi:hypothetical protein